MNLQLPSIHNLGIPAKVLPEKFSWRNTSESISWFWIKGKEMLRKPAEHRIHLCFLTADTMGTAGLCLPIMIDCIPS